ncbi:uncharacterized protein LODBEIA_P59350 [Lodderomyces beijingensis]|uniref:Mto2p-binding domain-containing protein n=1 Tax=Lodderomyces beijingensis TaxID=1775926 RepID=A0ABP0ZUB0_9ASCO
MEEMSSSSSESDITVDRNPSSIFNTESKMHQTAGSPVQLSSLRLAANGHAAYSRHSLASRSVSPAHTGRDSVCSANSGFEGTLESLNKLEITENSPQRAGSESLNTSPWRQFRPANLPSLQGSMLNVPSLRPTVGTISREDELNKKVINYKIQLKLMKNFLQELIDKHEFNVSDLQRAAIFANLSSSSAAESKLKGLQKEYDEIFVLNQDLYSNLEVFQDKLATQEERLRKLESILNNVADGISEAFTLFGEEETKEEVKVEVEDVDRTVSADLRMRKLVDLMRRRLKCTETASSKSPTREENRVDSSVSSVTLAKPDLEDEVDRLQHELDLQIQHCRDLEDEIGKIQRESQETKRRSDAERRENAKKIDEYEMRVHEIEKQLTEEAANVSKSKIITSSVRTLEPNLMAEYLELQNAYSERVEELSQAHEAYEALEHQADSEIKELSEKLQQSSMESKSYLEQIETLKIELQTGKDKQRQLDTEHIQTTYANESLKKENQNLHDKIQRLTEFMSYGPNDKRPSPDTVKKLSLIEYQLKDLISFDLSQFQRLIQSYNKIADDKSLMDPTQKYEKMIKKLRNFEEGELTYIREKHKSVFEYFSRATDILINDHVRLLLKDDAADVSMQKKMDKLSQSNAALQQELDAMRESQSQESSEISSITALRMNDLRKKWKAERERRVLEDRESHKRFTEMEEEISRLKHLLGGA